MIQLACGVVTGSIEPHFTERGQRVGSSWHIYLVEVVGGSIEP